MAGNQTLWYTEATAKIFFPENHVCCAYCPILETYARNQCRRTGEYLANIKDTIGYMCPLEFEQRKEEN